MIWTGCRANTASNIIDIGFESTGCKEFDESGRAIVNVVLISREQTTNIMTQASMRDGSNVWNERLCNNSPVHNQKGTGVA